jgi:small-conductance mechanosensitive channel
MLPNSMIVIPNSKLSQSIVTNYCLPEKQVGVSIPVRLNYTVDPDQVERILTDEVKKAVNEIPGLLSTPEPAARFIPGFGDNSLDFTVTCQVREFADQGRVQHELRRRIFYRLKKERIELARATGTSLYKPSS